MCTDVVTAVKAVFVSHPFALALVKWRTLESTDKANSEMKGFQK